MAGARRREHGLLKSLIRGFHNGLDVLVVHASAQ
jgi:hypothetical protein